MNARDDSTASYTYLERFRDEVRFVALHDPRAYITGWGSARYTIALVQREIDVLKERIEKEGKMQ